MKSLCLEKTLLLVLLTACCFAGCAPWVELPKSRITPQLSVTPELRSSATPAEEASPTSSALPSPSTAAQPTSAPKKTLTPSLRPPSGWSIFSNPDYVQGIAQYQDHLWSATLGGVVDWNLDTQTPVVYTTRDGLVEIQANDVVICPMPEDRVIVSHETGILSAYDLGLKKWSQIPITFSDGTTLKGVRAMRCDEKNNRLLVGSVEGVGILNLKTDRWQRIGENEGLNVKTIRAIDVVGQSIWLAAGDQSAFMIQGKMIYPFNGASGFPSGPVNDLSVSPDASIWLGYPTGLVHYKDKLWYSYGSQTPAGGIPFRSVDQVEVASDKTVWIASATEGICPYDETTLFCSTIYPAPVDAPITDLIAGDDGVAYAATNGSGVLVLRSDRRDSLLINRQKLISNDILDIAEGQDGRIWIATGDGVNSFDPTRPGDAWEVLLPGKNMLGFDRVSGILPVSDGIWFTSDVEPQVVFQGETSQLILTESKGISGWVMDSALDHRGYIWFATDQGVDIWDGVTIRSYGPTTGLAGNLYQSLLEVNEVMWVGTDKGLLRYDHAQWSVALPEVSVNAIVPAEGDDLLLGSDRGLILFDGSQSYQWLINLGDEVVNDIQVTALAWDKRGELWVGTAEDGLFHYDGRTWERFDTARGMPTNSIRRILTDHLGAVWVAATTGQGGGALVRFMP